MPRAATTTDVFNAIAEPRRRQIIDLLDRRAAVGGMAVGAIVAALGLAQPAVSKHLAVLREVGIVTVAKQGQQRLYQLQVKELKHVHDWISRFERHWSHQLDRIKQRAERLASDRLRRPNRFDRKKGSPS
jgi:DNA-binding transcriptional ArsR family regulator